jgi:hypothetical protein
MDARPTRHLALVVNTLARRPRRGQWAAAGDWRWDRGQRPRRKGRRPPRPRLLPGRVP